MDVQNVFHAAVQSYLEETHGYDFIHEVIGVEYIFRDGEETYVEIDYRGTCGEYGAIQLTETLEDLLEAISC